MSNYDVKELRWQRCRRLGTASLLFASAAFSAPLQAQEHQHHSAYSADKGPSPGGPVPVFVASNTKPFPALMADAMAVMDRGMSQAPMNGRTEHDFLTMMIPHHQGAVDMAKSVLLYSHDPAIRNLAIGIITEQQNEIKIMQAWLDQHK